MKTESFDAAIEILQEAEDLSLWEAQQLAEQWSQSLYLHRAVAAIEGTHRGRLELEGGYPAVVSLDIPGWVVTVTTDHDGAPMLETMTEKEATTWYRNALDWMQDHPECDLTTAMFETGIEN